METKLVPIRFDKILQTKVYTQIILATDEKRFAIYTDPEVGRTIQIHLTEEHKPRPYTHDLINAILDGLDIKPLQIVINDLEDTIFFARLFLEQTIEGKRHILEIDTRPSDCITLALMKGIPVFCNHAILEKAIPAVD